MHHVHKMIATLNIPPPLFPGKQQETKPQKYIEAQCIG